MAKTHTTETAGRINPEWLARARVNATPEAGEAVEDWIARAGNWRAVEIEADGAVCVHPGAQWLDQETIDRVCAAVDRGV